jgi:hypothetical protein
MAVASPTTEVDQETTVRNYFLVCMGSMLVVLLLLLRRGLGPWSLLPVVIGVAGSAFRLRFAPTLVLIVLAATLIAMEPFQPASAPQVTPVFNGSLPDWILSAAILAYFAAHYRLLGLTVAYFPVDPRASGKEATSIGDGNAPAASSLRSSKSITPSEMSWFIMSLPLYAVLAQVIWKLVPSGDNAYGLDSSGWQGVTFAWILGIGWSLVAGLLSYVVWQQRSPSEARMLLADVVWRELSRDLRRASRGIIGGQQQSLSKGKR